MGCCLSQEQKPSDEVGNAAGGDDPKGGNNQRSNRKVIVNSEVVIDGNGTVQFGFEKGFESKYVRGKELGKGQFGTTYECYPIGNPSEKYAAKIINKRNLTNKQAIEDVQKEVKIMRTLTGEENIVSFYDAFEDNQKVVLVLELCTGGELFDRIVTKGHYSEKNAADLVRQILKVVAHCHLKGVIHRDLKPENFLFANKSANSPLKVTDFGLSDFFTPETVFDDVAGSPYYVAPEVLKRKYTAKSDLWSVGVMTYILLSGEPPFWANTETGTFREILRGPLKLSGGIWDKISEEAKTFVRKLLDRSPTQRYSAAQALSDPWIRVDGVARDMPLDYSVLNSMKQFSGLGQLRQLFMRKVAETFQDDEIQDLRDQFSLMDTDGDGCISINEMAKAIQNMRTGEDKRTVIPEEEVQSILQAMDADGNGQIDYMEFISATLHVSQLRDGRTTDWKRRTRLAFNQIDADGNGMIDAAELARALGGGSNIQEMIKEADRNGDGQIDYEEFCSMLHSAAAARSRQL